jgi:predicted RNA-binding Zn-ribbon protein involved in translation (DUF1610 family)
MWKMDEKKVISLTDKKKEKRPHLAGEARCLSCRHEWVAVAEVGAVWLECPECHTMMGRFIHHAEMSTAHWVCECGNDLYYVTDDYIYCPVCGREQIFP